MWDCKHQPIQNPAQRAVGEKSWHTHISPRLPAPLSKRSQRWGQGWVGLALLQVSTRAVLKVQEGVGQGLGRGPRKGPSALPPCSCLWTCSPAWLARHGRGQGRPTVPRHSMGTRAAGLREIRVLMERELLLLQKQNQKWGKIRAFLTIA